MVSLIFLGHWIRLSSRPPRPTTFGPFLVRARGHHSLTLHYGQRVFNLWAQDVRAKDCCQVLCAHLVNSRIGLHFIQEPGGGRITMETVRFNVLVESSGSLENVWTEIHSGMTMETRLYGGSNARCNAQRLQMLRHQGLELYRRTSAWCSFVYTVN